MSNKPPRAPKKAPQKKIPRSSRFYTTKKENNKNLSNENVENVKELSETNLEEMVKQTVASPGNTNPNYSKSILNYKPNVPIMKLPAHLQSGGKRKTRKQKTRRMKKRTHKQKRRA